MFRAIPNLSSTVTLTIEDPWNHGFTLPSFANKNAYRTWCNDPTTEHAFITGFAGRYPDGRPNHEINPVDQVHHFVVDYDANPGPNPLALVDLNAPPGLRPTWFCRTYSGNLRLVYTLAAPIGVINSRFAAAFLQIAMHRLKLVNMGAGFDEEAFLNPYQFYEIGHGWTQVPGGGVIPLTALHGWRAEVSLKHNWRREGVSIPVNVLREAFQTRFPNRWPGGWERFDISARGPRFWDSDASDPTAAIVRETGMQFFSDGGGFVGWAGILGEDFVQQWQDNKIGAAIQGIWNCGNQYIRQLEDGQWKAFAKDDTKLHLKLDRGLETGGKGVPNEVESAILKIQNLNSVQAVVPLLYRPEGPVMYNGYRFLNTATLRVMEPYPGTVQWGEGFPWLATFFSTGFRPVNGPIQQIEYFLCWLKHFWQHARELDPRRGLGMFVAGPPGTGKTYLGKAILAQIAGRSADAAKYIVEGDKYNDELFESPLWTVDDAVASGNDRDRAKYSQTIKQVIANDQLVYRAMYASGKSAEWVGRTYTSMNDDAESLMMLPQADIAIFDKSLVLYAQQPAVDPLFPSNAAIAAELPYFLAWLRDWQPVPELQYDYGRFGMRAYAHPDLAVQAASISQTTTFAEVLTEWRKEWFRTGGNGADDPYWEGNPSSLQRDILRNEHLRPNMTTYRTPNSIGLYLHKLIATGVPWVLHTAPRTYRILRPTT